MKKTIEFAECGLAVELVIDEKGICVDTIDVSEREDLIFREMISAYIGHPIIAIIFTIYEVIPLYIAVRYGKEILKKREKEALNLMNN
jgi:hypothetical protein